MTEEAIRECPFCGSEASVESNKGLAFYVTCDRSGCNAYIGPDRCLADAIAAWNRRAGGEREQQLEAENLRFRVALTRIGVWDFSADECREIAKVALAGQTEGERNGG